MVGVAGHRDRWALAGTPELGDVTMVVACLAFDCYRIFPKLGIASRRYLATSLTTTAPEGVAAA
jgi:hypothetical protein